MTDWFRSWHGAPTDPKWLLIAKKAGVKPCHVAHLFWALLDHGSQHADRGFVGDFDQETFALFSGLEEEHVSRIVTQLSAKGLIVNDRIANWGKRQPKREDETANERQRRHRAGNGGNPPSGDTPGTPDGSAERTRHAMSRNVTPDKSRVEKISSDANASGTIVPHPASDFCKAVFDSARAILTQSGMNSRQAGSLIGRWRKSIGDAELLILIRQSEAEGHSDPAAWLTAAVENHNGRRQGFRMGGNQPDPLCAALERARAEERAEAGAGDDQAHDPGAWGALPSSIAGHA